MAVKTNDTCQLPPPPIDNHPLCLSANNAATANGADTPMESNHQQQSQLRNDMTTSNTRRRMKAANDTANVTHGRDTDERQESRSERSSGRADDDRFHLRARAVRKERKREHRRQRVITG